MPPKIVTESAEVGIARRPPALQRLERGASTLAATLERRSLWFLGGFSLLYFAGTLHLASIKPFWFDELFTHYIASSATLEGLWHALDLGLDHHPPFFFLVTRAAYRLIDDPHLAARLPAILGFWVMCICVFKFVTHRTSALYGAIAMTLPFTNEAFFYAYDARPYGLALGFCALALLSWQAAADGRRRPSSLLGMAVGIAAAISSSYYAVLIVAPFAAAELVRTLERKRIDWGIWAALAAGASVAFLYLPRVLSSLGGFSEANWASPYATVVINMYGSLFRGTTLILVALLGLTALFLVFHRATGADPASPTGPEPYPPRPVSPEGRRFLPHEVAAALGLLLLPFLGYLVAEAVTHKIHLRYVIYSVIGFSMLVSMLSFRAARGSALFGATFLALILSAAALEGVLAATRDIDERWRQLASPRKLLAGEPELPVAVDNHELAFELTHYEPRLAPRIHYLLDPYFLRRYALVPYGGEKTWPKMRGLFPVQSEDFGSFLKKHPAFLVYSTGYASEYLLPKLSFEGADIRLLGVRGNHHLYLVRP